MDILFGNFGEPISFVHAVCRIVVAVVIGAIIGYERERKNRPAGLRTHILVCIGSTIIPIVEQQLVYEVSNLGSAYVDLAVGRLTVAVISGIGFLGTGTIVVSKTRSVGLTTAASLWCTACLGVANGMGYSLLAFVSSFIVVFVLQALIVSKNVYYSRNIEIQYIEDHHAPLEIEELLIQTGIKYSEVSVSYFKEDGLKKCTICYSMIFKNKEIFDKIMEAISNIDNVVSVQIQNYI